MISGPKSSSVQAAVRVLAIVETLNHRHVTSLDGLHSITGLPKSTLVRLLETLIEAGYVVRVSRRHGYTLTEKVLRLSAGVRHRDVMEDVARPLMEAFTQAHKWEVSLSTRDADAMVSRFATRHISPFARENVFLNRRVNLLRTAVGRAYFAYCSPEEQRSIFGLIDAADPGEIERAGGRERIAAIVESVRRDGYATIVRPPENTTRSFAIPVLDRSAADLPLGSLVMFYYSSVMAEAEATGRYLTPMRELADAIAAGVDQARRWVESPVD